MASIVAFPDISNQAPALGHVGGKGMSLWRMSSVQSCSVPNGFVLTTAFFERWFDMLKKEPVWQNMLDSCKGYDPDSQDTIQKLHDSCEAAKAASTKLTLDDEQTNAVRSALDNMSGSSQGAVRFVAVRSSSPEEDLAGMSFAGGYETVLGVKAEVEQVQEAMQRVFASCLDERVFVYKISHSIADLTPRIAVVVQRQVAASVAGVAFSLDPISNCYDWATVNTNFGLGETVVSGQCSPDYYLVNKQTKVVIRSELGKKETAAWLGENGGVHEKAGDASQWTLSDEEVGTITTQLMALEQFYGHPIDTEFALDERGQLMWLQARPVTTHMQLPAQITTPPGAPEVLWLDIMQIVQGFSEPMSNAGMGFLGLMFQNLLRVAMGMDPASATIHNRPITFVPEAGMLYMNGSFILRLIGFNRKESWASKVELMDFSVARAIRELDDASLVNSANFVPLPLYLLWNCPGIPLNVRSSRSDFEGTVQRAKDCHAGMWSMARDLFQLQGHGDKASAMGAFQEEERPRNISGWLPGYVVFPSTKSVVSAQIAKMGKPPGTKLHIGDILEAVFPVIGKNILYGLVTTTISGALGQQSINAMFENAPEDLKKRVEEVTMGCTFVTTVLSDLLDEMAGALEEAGVKCTLPELTAMINDAGLPAKAKDIWQLVIDQFGHRGVGELDMSTPRYREDPSMLVEQVVAFLNMDKENRPLGLAAKARGTRDAAVELLSKWLSENGGDPAEFCKQVERYRIHFCWRESGKYLIIKFVELARIEVLAQAETLMKGGKLDALQDIWFLTMDDLRRVYWDESVDVRALVAERRQLRNKNAHVKKWPKLVTSRGRELRPKPREAKEGEVAGHPVSAGVAQGRIKVLHGPREKPLLTGEILVAKATDPGWTPLFVPAAAILLEVGGALQHGALVAREFGKPCVAGIENVTERFTDGQLVEVDGNEGIVKILGEGPVQSSVSAMCVQAALESEEAVG